MIEKMKAIGKLIREQDNRITEAPIFVVQEKVRDAGFDSGYASDYVWINYDKDYKEADERMSKRLDALDDDGRKFGAWERVYYIDRWEFVTACFTEQGCKDFISRDGHNHGECRIYAYGSYRNNEFRAVREYLIGLSKQDDENPLQKKLVELYRERALAREKLTEQQFVETITQAIECGDISIHTRIDDQSQKVVYKPNADKKMLQNEIRRLEELLRTHNIEPDA